MRLSAVLAAQLAACLVLIALLPAAWLPWALALSVALSVALPAAVGAAGAARWPGSSRRGSEGMTTTVPGVDGSGIGVSVDGATAFSALEFRPGSDALGFVGPRGRETEPVPRVPLGALATALLDPYREIEGLDVVVHGSRTAGGAAGRSVDALAGPMPYLGSVRVGVLIRFDLTALALRAGASSERDTDTIAVVTERLRRHLLHLGCAADDLDAAELDELIVTAARAGGSATAVRGDVGEREIAATLWEYPAGEIIDVTELRRTPGPTGRVTMTRSVACEPLLDDGDRLALRFASRSGAPGELDDAAPESSGWGQILGASSDGRMAVLPIAGVHLRSTLLLADLTAARRLLTRAAGAGTRMALVTDRPGAWNALVRAVDDPGLLHVAGRMGVDRARPVDAIVWDSTDAPTAREVDGHHISGRPDSPPPTVIRLCVSDDPGGTASGESALASPHDLVLDARVDGWLAIERPGHAPRSVRMVHGPDEEATTGNRLPADPEPLHT